MFVIDSLLLLGGVLLLVAVLASKLAARFGLPVLVLFMLVGMLAGEDGIGRIDFDNYQLAHAIGTVALCLILFDGGLRTPLGALRLAWKPSALLATLGVLITAAVTAVFAWLVLDLGWLEALLLGSIVGSTDAAAVFSILRSKGLHLKPRVAATLEVESGSNDPMAVLMTVAVLEALTGEAGSAADWLLFFVQQMGLGLVAGVVVGALSVALINRVRLDAAGLYPVLSGACCILSFGGAAALGGSGFLAVYVAGILIGNRRTVYQRGNLLFHDGMAWLGQMTMFLVLGLLCTPRELVGVALPGAAIALGLIFVARPLAVFVLLPLSGFTLRERVFFSWVGLKGAVPIVLATYPLLFGIESGPLIFNVIFFVVLVSAVAQGWSLPMVARWLGLQQPGKPAPPIELEITSLREVDMEVVQFDLEPRAPAVDRRVNELALPDGVVISVIARGSRLIPPRGSTRLKAGDHVFVVVKPQMRPLVDLVFTSRAPDGPPKIPALVEFGLPFTVRAGHLQDMYQVDLGVPRDWRLDHVIRETLGRPPEKGDVAALGCYHLHVREVEAGKVLMLGLVRTGAPADEADNPAAGA